MTNEDLNDYWIKVWTGDSSNENKAKWFKFEEFNNNNNTMTITVKPIDAAKVKNIETAQEFYALDNSDEKCEIPVFEGSNTISYRIMNIGGNKSSVHEVEITIHEGRNRQVRRMFEHFGYRIHNLKRIAYAGLTLGGVKRGASRQLTIREVKALKALGTDKV